ncbi:MAG: efflux RND transporter periplasmic adaptor subunit, partial [Bradyrhizobium sp.]|nr:efflux RND transporter periplasmic adaptor subunit [Bradyrhizobium sp.]
AASGAGTIQAKERAELTMRVAERDLRAAEYVDHATQHELGQLRAMLARYGSNTDADVPADSWNVTAPVGGLVLKVTQESETMVQPGTALLDLGDPHDLEVVVDVLSTDAVEIAPGADVTIDRWGGAGRLSGRVRRVEPAAFTKISTLGVEEQRVNVLIDIVSPADQWQRLGDAYQLDAQIAEAEVAIETARVNLAYTRITAPIDGTVLSIVTQQGQTVNAVQSAPTIVVLGQVETMTVRVEISEADVVKVKPGQNVYFTILGDPDRRFHATLGSIEPAPESIKTDSSFSSTSTTTSSSSSSSSTTSSAIYYNGVFNVANPDGQLMTYMTAEVHILLGEARKVPTIPSSALGNVNPDGSYTVRLLNGASALEKRNVRIGLNNKIRAEVKSGLSEGERVVISTPEEAPKQTVMPPPASSGGP